MARRVKVQGLTLLFLVKIGATAVGSAVIAPAVGIATLGLVGFTSNGIAAGKYLATLFRTSVDSSALGSLAASMVQSVSAFGIVQAIGARAAFPVIMNVVAGVVGGRTAAASRAGHKSQQRRKVGDIGDDP